MSQSATADFDERVSKMAANCMPPAVMRAIIFVNAFRYVTPDCNHV
jgi:hypothetical protein